MKPIQDGWYLNTQSNSESKFLQLRSISDQLSLDLTIELGTNFEVQREPQKKKRNRLRAIDKLRVKFPHGEYIASGRASDTYLKSICKLGIEDIKRKHLTWGARIDNNK